MRLIEKIRKKQARACVMGLGYVGLPLALELARAGYRVAGLDSDAARVGALREGRSRITDVSSESLSEALGAGRLEFTSDERALGEADVISICVPTPLGKTGDPDLSFVRAALEGVRRRRRRG